MKNKISKLASALLVAGASYFVPQTINASSKLVDIIKEESTSMSIYLSRNGNDIYDGSLPGLAVQTLDRALEIQKVYSEGRTGKFYVGDGLFEASTNPVTFNQKTEIYGAGIDKTIFNNTFMFKDWRNREKVVLEDFTLYTTKYDPYMNREGIFVLYGALDIKRVKIVDTLNLHSNLQVTGLGVVHPTVSIEDCVFQNLTRAIAPSEVYDMTLNRTIFENVRVAINSAVVNRQFDVGTLENPGKNVFKDVEVFLFAFYYDFPTNIVGNYWVDTILNEDGTSNKYVYTDPQEILEKKIDYNPEENISISNPLRWNPLCKPTDLDEDYDTDSVDVQESILQALGIDYADRKPADVNNDGRIDAVDVQSVILDSLKE